MASPYFGPTWDAPLTDGAVQVDTPIGVPCIECEHPVADGDRGILMGHVGADGGIEIRPMHRECLLLSTSGHIVKVCHCHGRWPVGHDRREMALEAWRRIQLLKSEPWIELH